MGLDGAEEQPSRYFDLGKVADHSADYLEFPLITLVDGAEINHGTVRFSFYITADAVQPKQKPKDYRIHPMHSSLPFKDRHESGEVIRTYEAYVESKDNHHFGFVLDFHDTDGQRLSSWDCKERLLLQIYIDGSHLPSESIGQSAALSDENSKLIAQSRSDRLQSAARC